MSHPLRVAVLSFWHVHAGDYARSTVQHPDTELVAVWDDDVARGEEGAERFGVPFEPDLDALLARDDVDAVTVTTETSVHREVLTRAAAAGKHIFTEKLLAPTVAEAEEIIAACDANGVKLTVSLPRLYHGYTQVVRQVMADGRLGDLTYGRVRLSHDGAVRDWLPPRFYDPEPAIGGALTDLGCHPVYLTQLFLGFDPDTVQATYRSVTDRAVEDNASVTIGYADGAIGVIEAGFASPSGFSIEICGTKGALRYHDQEDVIHVTGDGDPEALPVPEHLPDAFSQWVGHIADGSRADANLAAAIELTRLVVAANDAAATGTTVRYA